MDLLIERDAVSKTFSFVMFSSGYGITVTWVEELPVSFRRENSTVTE